ncbi:MAG TPA: aldo/keto reductase [Devosia sp.]|nr:aldo/keto reductase [Devosia sp.]
MKHHRLGRTDISVSEICLGTMTWGRQNSEAEGHAQIDMAMDMGVNFMDTAELYAVPINAETAGETERIIGTWFKKSGKRDRWILASKVVGRGIKWIRNGERISGPGIRKAIEGSLRRLQTDHIDLYQLHWPNRGSYHFENSWTYDPFVQEKGQPLEDFLEALQTLDDLMRAGKIRAIGLSNETAWGTMQYLALAEKYGLPRIASIQNEYNLLRRYYDLDLAELARHEDVGLLAFSPLAAGVLTGKYLDGACPRGSRMDIQGSLYRSNELTEPAVRKYLALAQAHGLDPAQMALAFCLSRPFMTSVIIGATSLEQLKTDIGAADISLSDDVLDGIQEIYRQHPRPL